MRTIDTSLERTSARPAALLRVTVALRRLASIPYDLLTGAHRRNHVSDLSAQQLQDIGFEDGRIPPRDGFDRVARQDAQLREARTLALMLMMGSNGR